MKIPPPESLLAAGVAAALALAPGAALACSVCTAGRDDETRADQAKGSRRPSTSRPRARRTTGGPATKSWLEPRTIREKCDAATRAAPSPATGPSAAAHR